ncbi:MAG: FecR family protein [Sulfuricurvum sp.]|uniref:FecR family protein n=1 Tax=Sulfuricurvum sp. TaxID=2025608 RepID=UPI002638AF4B|nr:FecR family protein [Sulfuricurvum sp.]MDD2829471.1 FecR family protein [Sulfuricurvum sp.]MDD4948446.1 FecR family protein [Sulfuricurvum sp.]
MIRTLLSFILALTLSASLHASVAKITSLTGTALIERDTKNLPAALGNDLESKDTIATSENSKAQLTFKDNTIITVGKKSRFSIEEYLYDSSDSSNAKFNILSGTVRTMSGKIGKIAPEKFAVKTKTATIGIRGTDFVIHVGDEGEISAYCLQGAIVVLNSANIQNVVDMGSYISLSKEGVFKEKQTFTPEEIKTLLGKNFTVSKTSQPSNESVTFETALAPIIAAEGSGDLLQHDESLDKHTNIEEIVSTIKSDSAIVAPKEAQTYTGLMTSLFDYGSWSHIKEGAVTLVSDPSTQTVTGDIGVPALYSTIHLGSTTSYSSVNTFDTQLASIEDSSGNIIPLPSGSYLKTCACNTDDYFTWGEWEKVSDPNVYGDPQAHGYWVAGVETPSSVLDAYRSNSQTLNYTGTTFGSVNTVNVDGFLTGTESFSGSSAININFETDTFTAAFAFSTPNDQYNLEFTNGSSYANTLSAGSISTFGSTNLGDMTSQSPTGNLQGKFYGTDGKTVGGTFHTSSTIPNSSDSLILQGAFKAKAP